MYAYLAGGSDAGDITLPDVYTYEPFGGLVPLPKTIIYNHVKVHAWTGTVFEDNGGNQGDTETMVYVTASGSVCHKDPGCSYLNVSLKQVSGSSVLSMNNQYGEHYSACETCSRNEKPAGIVYVTDQGNRYHNLESCSGLKRSVRLVKESSVSGKYAVRRSTDGNDMGNRNIDLSWSQFLDRHQKERNISDFYRDFCNSRYYLAIVW